MWVSFAKRQLTCGELQQPLTLTMDKDIENKDANGKALPPVKTVLFCCLSLVSVNPATDGVHLFHQMAREYFTSSPKGPSLAGDEETLEV